MFTLKTETLALMAATILALTGLAVFASQQTAAADDGWASLVTQSTEVHFPDDVVFVMEFTSTRPVERVTLSFSVVGREAIQREPATLEEGDRMIARFTLKTRGGSSTFIPPGADMTYHWIFEDSKGNSLETEPVTFTYMDSRFDWETVSKESVTVYYNGPIQTRAETILDTAVLSLSNMGRLLESRLTRPVKIVTYNNPIQMEAALPFVSRATSSGLVTQGQAYSDEGVLLVMAFDSQIRGIVSHEVTHLLIAQAAEGPGRRIPDWLNEGLAEYGNIEPGFSYDQALLYGIRSNIIFPLTQLTNRPGRPDDAIIFYGHSRAVVSFMVETYGPDKMADLLRLFRDGDGDIDDALTQVYGFDRVGLDNAWRDSIGLPHVSEERVAPRPKGTPTPVPTRVPLGARTPTPALAPTPGPSEPSSQLIGQLPANSESLALLRGAYGTRTGAPGFLASADLNGDQTVNYLDLAIFASQFSAP